MANETQTDLFGFKGWKKYGNKKTLRKRRSLTSAKSASFSTRMK